MHPRANDFKLHQEDDGRTGFRPVMFSQVDSGAVLDGHEQGSAHPAMIEDDDETAKLGQTCP